MNDLRERLDRLADAAAEGVEVSPPERRPASRPWWRTEPALVAISALVIIGVITAAVLLGRDDGDDVAVGKDDGSGSVAQGDDAVVAVIYGDLSLGGGPGDLRLRFLDADGAVIAERSSSEVDRGADTPEVSAVVQRVPAGELGLEATLQDGRDAVSCTQPFTAAAGDRLILRVQLGLAAGAECAQVESVDDWVAGRTGPTGESYIGLTQAEADEQAQAAGLTTRVVGIDGQDLAATMDFRPDRLNLMLFDGIVVAAQLDGEEAAASGTEPGGVDALRPVVGGPGGALAIAS